MITLGTILFLGGLFRFIFGIIWFALIVLTIIDLLKSTMPLNTKLLWLIVILIAPVIGSIIYFVWGRHQRL